MRVLGKNSGKWQDVEVIRTPEGKTRFRVTGACKCHIFDLDLDQLMSCITTIDLGSCDPATRELILLKSGIV